MSAPQKGRQPPTKPWCWNTLQRLESDAWRSRKINTVRFIEFLEREDMRHGAAENGNLKAPYEQLEAWGISARHVKAAIDQAIELGLVEATSRPGERMMSTFALTWLPFSSAVVSAQAISGIASPAPRSRAIPPANCCPHPANSSAGVSSSRLTACTKLAALSPSRSSIALLTAPRTSISRAQ